MSTRFDGFADRADAGRVLARRLRALEDDDVVVLGLPRGGVPVAAKVAAALDAPLDVWVVRKLGVPGHEELAMGAIAAGGGVVLDFPFARQLGLTRHDIEEVARRELTELRRREASYRRGRGEPDIEGKTALVVDDGLATGSTMQAAVRTLRQHDPERIVVAVPVGSRQACAVIGAEVDELICLQQPEPFVAVGYWYADFSPTTDGEVQRLLGFDPEASVES
ncbi:MAG TPA: phosphoribosyltransferase family protein [Baekduia sp.]|nr:phosphoribosyltransferase family protein [Baekduia sp.]